MLLLAILALQQPVVAATDSLVHSGRAGQTIVHPPRLPGEIVIDGVLDEPQWQQAVVLTGFSERSPVDGQPAPDSTEVRVWYSSTALYLGIHAIDRTGTVRATLATRDQIFNDDNVQIFLSTFNDGRQATVFAVNPLGVQADGALNENGSISCSGVGTGCASQTRQAPDLSPDFVWDSKGRVTSDGYDVEVRIPFKSIRFQAGKSQTWGINILRVVQRTGQEQTWTMTHLGASSFLGEAGHLIGLSGLEAGHTLDLIPTVTSSITSTPEPGGGWNTDVGRPQVGGDLAYGITPNLTLRATAHPDFSQVESDITQFAFDPRQKVFYPEKRPFFLDGAEQFDAPGGLIYTRNIVQPIFAGKLAGKVGDNQVGFLAAVDDPSASRYANDPVFGIFRASHDLGPGSRLGLTWTEQHDGPETNRVVGADTRIVWGGINSLNVSGAVAHDNDNGVINDDPIWGVNYRMNGRHVRINVNSSAIGDNFITRSGFITQPGIANFQVDPGYTWLWPRGALQSFTTDVLYNNLWRYQDFIHARPSLDRQLHFNFAGAFRSGWNTTGGLFIETFGYDSTIYTSYRIRQPDGTFTPFTGGGTRLPNHDFVLSINSPIWKGFDFNTFELAGLNDENYGEWASGRVFVTGVGADVRPSHHLRLNVSLNETRVIRPDDGSRELLQDVFVGTLEYQLSRAFQLRLIPQYSINSRDSLRDDSRTGLPIYFANPDGTFSRASASDQRSLQLNFLFTYLPNPGTVIYLGYGTVDQRPNSAGLPQLGPVQSSFFLKLSYLWRMRS